jgi:hypothetical protein
MYVVTNHNTQIAEWTEARNLRGTISDLETIIENNEIYRRFLAEKDSGRPGHYYGRDVVLEGSMPMAGFLVAALEFGGDEDWYKDDAKFQDFMKRHPEYDWLNGG